MELRNLVDAPYFSHDKLKHIGHSEHIGHQVIQTAVTDAIQSPPPGLLKITA